MFTRNARMGAACRYPDCLHLEEKHCAVRQGVQYGAIRAERYESYRKLLEEAFPGLT